MAKLLLPDFTLAMSQYRVGANRKGFATFRGQCPEKEGGKEDSQRQVQKSYFAPLT